MVSYKVITTPKALSQLNSYIDYIQFTLLNNQAAEAVWEDAVETVERLETVAGIHEPCKHPKLKAYGYYPILFSRHRYVMLYRTEDNTVYVDAVYHELQDYESTFSKDLK